MPTAAPGDKDKDLIRFPPFPIAPEGVAIIPFGDWLETGIQIFSTRSSVKKTEGDKNEAQDLLDDDIEVDGLGIPTIELSKKHDTDTVKSDARKRRKARDLQRTAPAKAKPGEPLPQKFWWHDWEDIEKSRLAGPYERGMISTDRVYQAAHDFKATSKSWPPEVTNLWDKWRSYVGLLGTTPVWRRKDKLAKELAEDDAVLEDLDSDDEEPEEPSAGVERPPQSSSQPNIHNILEEVQYRNDGKLVEFISSMEMNTAIFLSSYIHDKGFVWSDGCLEGLPRILNFFLRFIRHNRLLPDPQHASSITATIELTELAIKELPLTSKIAKLYPDRFSNGALECWGEQSQHYVPLFLDSEIPSPASPAEDTDAEKISTPAAEDISTPAVVESDAAGSVGWGVHNQDNMGWESMQTWPEPINSSSHTSVPVVLEPSPFSFAAEEPDAAQDPASEPEQSWSLRKSNSLMDLLGPTALPLTHTPGVVESSMRRLKSVIMPVPTNLTTPESTYAAGVEHTLETTFAKVVFEPWFGWDGHKGHRFSEPTILTSSRGAVITLLPQERNPAAPSKEEGIHDMYKDEIVVLVEPKVAEMMAQGIGMGYGGVWVEIVRREEVEDENPDLEAARKLEDAKVMKYWYSDELMMIIPSFNL
ncbi:hypothetical protein BDN72DRAFT_793464 [Pluteus cervinus]|uniref:Uncharacterized protein n=1 Tax=Pluteus cervinus TaxID=181527 RepID=A0ACD3B168_9AGAR|nr:hypothetical protein BDN72DRAFT_793464 [Pluteus cervinus]